METSRYFEIEVVLAPTSLDGDTKVVKRSYKDENLSCNPFKNSLIYLMELVSNFPRYIIQSFKVNIKYGSSSSSQVTQDT